ncbi:hypothetical protein CK203_050562 [Vitis vinifera]|uniref:Retrotransposon Copia-like N-terminal domain-containing protein n=1 Tax=Vitis vinifera TaxID=29760 RepID=A0A438GFK5_VITVI|nr:hypothetical protein CK203_050562 [Vitis vinifera]
MITSEKLVGSENYLSWSASVELWFMGQGYEDHLITQEADIPEAKGLYTNEIQRLYKVASIYLYWSDASLKEEFLIVMPFTPDVGFISSSLDDVFARLLRISSTQTLPFDSTSDSSVLVSQTSSRGGRSGTRDRGQRPHCTYYNKLGHTRDRCYQLHGRPPRTAHVAQSSDSPLPQPPSSSASQASVASVAQPGIGLALPLPFYLSLLSFILLNDRSTGKTIGIGRGEKLLETPGAIYTKPLVGRVWKVLEMPRDVHTSLYYGGRHRRSPRLSREF